MEFAQDGWDPLTSLAIDVSKKIVDVTDLRLLYVIKIDPDETFTHFIQALHGSSIQTIAISHPSTITSSVLTDRSKNIIFILDDVDQLFDLIFYTISRSEPFESNHEKVKAFKTNEVHNGCDFNWTMPRYCIETDKVYNWLGRREDCSHKINIRSSELEDGSNVSDSVHNTTRDLYWNKIWNFRNHLIFVLKNFGQGSEMSMPKSVQTETLGDYETGLHESLTFCFKFFWRFFKGQRSIICLSGICKKYDPFKEIIISYRGNTDETFFDFSWKNMYQKPLGVFFDWFRVNDYSKIIPSSPINGWMVIPGALLDECKSSLNYTLRYFEEIEDDLVNSNFRIEDVPRFGVDMIFFRPGIMWKGADFSKYDFSIGYDISAVCIATPHSGYMPQSLVIFQGFKPVVWFFIAVTIVIFCAMQFLFQYAQSELFYRLYTNAEIDHYRDSSSLLTVFAYFICGSPPSLRLGQLHTGKILFVIFSFSSIIISTVFLSGMTTLLSDRVMYPEIDSLKSLEESNLLIQIADGFKDDILKILEQLDQTETLKSKVVDSFTFYTNMIIGDDAFSNLTLAPPFDYTEHKYILPTKNEIYGNVNEEVLENVRSVGETDAFLVEVPFSSSSKENLRIRNILTYEWFNYHLVRDCMMTYPVMIPFMRGSFYFETVNWMLAQYFENGLARRLLDDFEQNCRICLEEPEVEDSGEPRPFTMNDLQSAFIGLSIGLFLSFLAFLGELLVDHFQHSTFMKFLARLKGTVFRKIGNGV
ncbi:unnamed protein product [Bemisia tabaci]|uniref:Ionotropic receptor n=1 Tax=Bemisia tabaci TaxID=7038 RepID=A0A9P0AE78_BEMTA|nr:unnamed protein product [Bemisia tabaci]